MSRVLRPLASGERVGIFWGGGLGDLLVLRPLLMAFEARLTAAPVLYTTAQHLPNLLAELSLTTHLQVLPRKAAAAVAMLRRENSLDLLYIGPYTTLSTLLLAKAVKAREVWHRRHADADPFIGEQVLADARSFDLDVAPEPYGGPLPGVDGAKPGNYLLLHPGAKDGWKTKQWPPENWREFMLKLLAESPLDLMLVGSGREAAFLQELTGGVPEAARARVSVKSDLSLSGLAALVATSAGVICHNSGILHLAAMLGKTTIALTGSSARFWRPPYPHVINITSGLCNLACNQYHCPVPFYHARCIRRLEVEAVMGTVRERLFPRP